MKALKPPPEHANLRLCPFCGGKPKLCRNGDTDSNIYYIECEVCESFAHRDGIGTTLEDGIMEVSALWNRRDPAAIIPDPNNAEMVECVARVIEVESSYVISQHHAKALARATLTALAKRGSK